MMKKILKKNIVTPFQPNITKNKRLINETIVIIDVKFDKNCTTTYKIFDI